MYCPTCSKQFKRKHAYQSHILNCPKLFDENSNNDLVLPSSLQMYHMLINLNKKCIKMENEIIYLKKLNLKNYKQNELSWLNENCKPNIYWENFIDNINLTNIEDYMEKLFEKDLLEVMKIIIEKLCENNIPFTIFKHSKNYVYIYERNNDWIKKDKQILNQFYEIIHKNLLLSFNNWTENNNLNIEHIAYKYNNTVIKLLGSNEDSLNKIYIKLNNFITNLINIEI